MKSKLVKLNKKEFEVKMGDKKMYNLGGVYYCSKCAYQLTPKVVREKHGFGYTCNIYLDTACLCDTHK